MKEKTTRRVRVKLDFVIEYDRDLTACPITANEIGGSHMREIHQALTSAYALRPGAKRLGLDITMFQLDYRKPKGGAST